MAHRALTGLVLAVAAASPARAGEPVMPLADVHPGMRCAGLSVVRGTEPSRFDAEVLDVIGGTRLLIRVSGPAVDATGIGPGFSGSPVLCPDAAGVERIAGAISEGIGEYGGRTVLATPIEAILDEPAEPPGATRQAVPGAHPLAVPLTVGGLSPPVASALGRAARRAGRVVLAAPGRAAAAGPAPALRPGSAMAAGIATGDVSAASIGTVAYVDGDRVWAFGHPLDSVGRRGLFLQAARVHAVVSNPLGLAEASTYKLASPLQAVGTLTNDAPEAVVGRLGALPRSFPLTVHVRDGDTRRLETLRARVADESAVGLPTGTSALSQVAPVMLAQGAYSALRGSPAKQRGRMCMRVALRERPRPLRFCNDYAGGGGPNSVAAPLVADVAEAVALLDGFRLGTATPRSVEINATLRRGQRQAYLTGARGPRSARRGTTVRVRLRGSLVRGGTTTRTVRLRIPASTPRGPRAVVFTGTPTDLGAEDLGEVITLSLGEDDSGDDPGPRSLKDLARRFARLGRFGGVRYTLAPTRPRRLFLDRSVRWSGNARLRLTIR